MSVFEYGVASGDPAPGGVVLWTRVSAPNGGAIDLRWTVAADANLSEVVQSGTATTDAGCDHTVQVEVGGLEPAATYHYAFEALGERSPVGRTKTLPDGSVDGIRIAVTSCAKYTAGYFNTYRLLAGRDDIDLWLHLGDYIYEYPTDDGKAPGPAIGRPMDPPHECRTLDDYRRRYAHYRRDPDVQALHALVPIVTIPDDHEFCNDTWREGAKNHDPDEDGPWADRKTAALSAWREWLPHRLPQHGDKDTIYRDFALGSLVDLIVLDARTMRDEMTKDRDTLNDPDRTMLGAEQFAWLTDRLRSSTATWRLVATPVMVGQVYTEFLPSELGNPLSELGILTDEEHGPNPDQWDGYPRERARLFEAIRTDEIRDIVFTSGDVHSSWAVELREHPKDDADPLAVEFVTTSVTSENLDDELGTERRSASIDVEARVRDDNPHVRFVELDDHGYLLLDIAAERMRASWHYVEALRERSDGSFDGPTWEVKRGESRLREVSG